MDNRSTKIICTIGPASESYEMLQKMQASGMNIARLNFSHGTHANFEKIIKRIQKLNKTIASPVGILLDTKGPEIRTANEPMELVTGTEVHVHVDKDKQKHAHSILIDYADLIDDVNVGDKIKLDNGIINLRVTKKEKHSLTCTVIDGGSLGLRRHVNLPGVHVKLPAITDKDRSDILFGLANDIDFIALSFVRKSQDILDLRELLGVHSGKVKIIAKIEDQEGLGNVPAIIKEADGIMVARGDLGVEIEIEDLPNVQRQIVRLCAEAGKRAIVATHMLESMIENPIPTRAEVTDVSNAVYQEVDAVMLSGETTVGKFPLRCIEQLASIAIKTEASEGAGYAKNLKINSKKQHIAATAVALAQKLDCRAIMVLTQSGLSADLISNCKPMNTQIYAFTFVKKTFRTMQLNRGVIPFLTKYRSTPEKAITAALEDLREKGGFQVGEEIVVIADHVLDDDVIQSIQVRHIR